jgi:hypothetical protein
MIDPLRFDRENIPTYEVERPAYCVSCLSQRQTRNNPNVAVIFCQECPNLLGERKEYGCLLCSTCNVEKHKAFACRLHVRQIIVVGPGLRKKLKQRGDGVNFPLPLDHVTISLKTKIFHNGKKIHREKKQTLHYISGMSGKCLHIQILGARNLGISDLNLTSDPYVVYSFCGKPLGSTRIRPRTLNPKWDNETFIVPLEEAPIQPRNMIHSQKDLIKLEVYDHDWLSQNDFLGHIELTKSKLAKLAVIAQEQPIRIPLTSKEYHGIISLQLGHNTKELFIKIHCAEDLDKKNGEYFNNPFAKVTIGQDNVIIGQTSIVKRTINPIWINENEFKISLYEFFQIEEFLFGQLHYYRTAMGLTTATSGDAGATTPTSPMSQGGIGGRGRRGGQLQAPMKRKDPNSRVMFEEFNDLPEYLAIIKIEMFNKRFFRADDSLGKTLIQVEQLRLMIPELSSLYEEYQKDPSSFLLKDKNMLPIPLLGDLKKRGKSSRSFRQSTNNNNNGGTSFFSRYLPSLLLKKDDGDLEHDSRFDHSKQMIPTSDRLSLATTSAAASAGLHTPSPSSGGYALLNNNSTKNNEEDDEDEEQQSKDQSKTSNRSRKSTEMLPVSPLPIRRKSSNSVANHEKTGIAMSELKHRKNSKDSNSKSSLNSKKQVSIAASMPSLKRQLSKKSVPSPPVLSRSQSKRSLSSKKLVVDDEKKSDASDNDDDEKEDDNESSLPSNDDDDEEEESGSDDNDEEDDGDADEDESGSESQSNSQNVSSKSTTSLLPSALKQRSTSFHSTLSKQKSIKFNDPSSTNPLFTVTDTSTPISLTKMKSFLSKSARSILSTSITSADLITVYSDIFRLSIINKSKKLKLQDVIVDDRNPEEEDLGFLIIRLLISNRGKVIPAIDEAVQRMTLGETSFIKSRYDYLYGSYSVSRNIPPRSNAILTIKLLEINGSGRYSIFLRNFRRIYHRLEDCCYNCYRYCCTNYQKKHSNYLNQLQQEDPSRYERKMKKESTKNIGYWFMTYLFGWCWWCNNEGKRKRKNRRNGFDDSNAYDESGIDDSGKENSLGSSDEDNEGEDDINGRDDVNNNNGKRSNRKKKHRFDDEYEDDDDYDEEEALLEENERRMKEEEEAAGANHKPGKLDPRIKKHMNVSVKAGAKLMWNTNKTKLFEKQDTSIPDSPPAVVPPSALKKKGKVKLSVVSEDNEEEDEEEGQGIGDIEDDDNNSSLSSRQNGED